MTDKYDRQLRLWGRRPSKAHPMFDCVLLLKLLLVQRALMEARICVIGAGPTATETLRNLVLPGCGSLYASLIRIAVHPRSRQ